LPLKYFNRLFWDIYGGIAWDCLQLPNAKNIIDTIVNTLKDKQILPGEKVLDAGCGTGNYAIALAEKGFHVTGIDYSAGMLRCAKSKVTDELAEWLTFQQMDMNKQLTFPDSSFDHVISMTSLWTVADPKFTLGELTRVMKPAGTLIVMQVPKPVKSLPKAIKNRIKHLENKTPTVLTLIVIKTILERTRANKYWTPEELLALLLTNKGLDISYVDHGPPIIVVATKIKAT
jgi:ubiquinone/menaquinone biosynthesis C-methylase UbiE